jgi:hypothetical protein
MYFLDIAALMFAVLPFWLRLAHLPWLKRAKLV